MENFGSYLRNERELRGIPLEEIADSTKIHMRFLQALESNHYDKDFNEVLKHRHTYEELLNYL